jgi:ABC-2 type transport system permease protein
VRAAALLSAKDLRLRLRDRSILILGLVAPLGLAFIFTAVLGDVTSGEFQPAFAVVDEDGGEAALGLVGALEQVADGGFITLESGSRDDLEAKVEAHELDAVFVIPDGFSAAVSSGGPTGIDIVGDVDAPTMVLIAESIATTFANEIETVRLSVAAAVSAGAGDPASLAEEARSVPSPIAVGAVDAAVRELDLTTFFVTSMAIFFLFFTVQFGVSGLLEERQQGTLRRLLVAPISPYAIVGGKLLTSFLLGVVSMAILAVASTLLMGADWGDPLGVAILVVAAVLSAMGIMTVVIAFARTTEAAGNLQAIIAVGLGMLGGNFFPGSLGTGLLANLAYITPHRWFMLGLGDLAGGGGLSVIWPSVLALVTFAVVTGGLASLRLRSEVLQP